MTNTRLSVLFPIVAAILVHSMAAQEPPTPQQLIDTAQRVSDLTKLGAYTLTANVLIDSGDKKTTKTGRLTIYRNHNRVRQELEIGGDREVRWFLGDKQYVIPGPGLLSELELKDLDNKWDLAGCCRMTGYRRFTAVRRDTVEGVDAWCLSRDSEHPEPSACFDAVKGVFLGQIHGERSSTQFFDFIPAEDQHLYPRRAVIAKNSFGRIEVDSIEIKPDAAIELFTPPDNAFELEACKGMNSLKLIYAPDLEFPEQERRQKKQGVVRLSAIIDKEGKVATAAVLTSPTEGFARQAVATVKRWKYEPSRCNGRAMNSEVAIELDFHLY